MGNMASRDPKMESSFVSDEEYQDRVEAFINGGACKETYAALGVCAEKAERMREGMDKCMPMLLRCMEAHSDYYQPLIAARKSAEERVDKEMDDFYDTKLGGSSKEYNWFMEGGCCKESFVAWKDCCEKEGCAKCTAEKYTLRRCMEAHSYYYERPFDGIQKIGDDHMKKEIEAALFKAD